MIYILRFFVRRRHLITPENAYLLIINQGVLVVFIIRMMRTGNYISQGFFFFFFLYYFTHKLVRQSTSVAADAPAVVA